MALIVKDRVKETTTTTGTGTITLLGAAIGFQSFSVIGNGNTTYYCIAGQSVNEWEVGIGTYTASGTTLSRDVVLESSNSGSLVPFSAGTKDVFVTYPAEKAVYQDANNVAGAPIFQANNGLFVNNSTVSTSYTVTTGTNAMSVGPITVSSGQSVTISSGQKWIVF